MTLLEHLRLGATPQNTGTRYRRNSEWGVRFAATLGSRFGDCYSQAQETRLHDLAHGTKRANRFGDQRLRRHDDSQTDRNQRRSETGAANRQGAAAFLGLSFGDESITISTLPFHKQRDWHYRWFDIT